MVLAFQSAAGLIPPFYCKTIVETHFYPAMSQSRHSRHPRPRCILSSMLRAKGRERVKRPQASQQGKTSYRKKRLSCGEAEGINFPLQCDRDPRGGPGQDG